MARPGLGLQGPSRPSAGLMLGALLRLGQGPVAASGTVIPPAQGSGHDTKGDDAGALQVEVGPDGRGRASIRLDVVVGSALPLGNSRGPLVRDRRRSYKEGRDNNHRPQTSHQTTRQAGSQ